MPFAEIIAALRSRRYSLTAIAHDTNLNKRSVLYLKWCVNKAGSHPEVIERVADWLANPRDLRDKYPYNVRQRGRPTNAERDLWHARMEELQ